MIGRKNNTSLLYNRAFNTALTKIRRLCLGGVICICCLLSVTPVRAGVQELGGDLDGNSTVNVNDLKYVANTWLEFDSVNRPAGDANGDGKVDFSDVSVLAIQWRKNVPIDFSLFIGPSDCLGANQFADPCVFLHGDAWYLTSTYVVGRPMYMFSTTDWQTKTRYTLDLNLNVNYLRNHLNDSGLNADAVWGFSVYRHTDGSFHGYGTIHVGYYRTFVCHFRPLSSGWPVTRWSLDKVLVGSPWNIAYESKVYNDSSGLYLLYVDTLNSGDNHVMAQRMLDPDDIDTSFQARAILSPEGLMSEYRNPPYGMQICEGMNISHVVLPSGSRYVMFYSVGDFALDNYKLGVAFSNSLIPPAGQKYVKPKVYDQWNIWENVFSKYEVVYTLQTQKSGWFNYCGKNVNGPGLGNLVEYMGNNYIVFHARLGGQMGSGKGRWVWMCPVDIDFGAGGMDKWVTPRLPD